MNNNRLEEIAKEIRKSVINSISTAGSGHTGGSLGLADVFACLYFSEMNHRNADPKWNNRDRLILSIGHVAPVLYATLAHAGYFPVEELQTLRKLNSRLQGHPGKEHGLPGIELSAGSLGQGLSVAVGMALSAKHLKQDWRTYCILGDGELQEGSVWEAAMSAGHYKLNNLIAIVDRNFVQIDGQTEEVMKLEPLADKWKSFNWNVISTDGNSINDIMHSFEKAKQCHDKPTVIIANTKMGAGVASIAGDYKWHGKAPNEQQRLQFLEEINHG